VRARVCIYLYARIKIDTYISIKILRLLITYEGGKVKGLDGGS